MQAQSAWIFANGQLEDAQSLRKLIHPGELLIAADAGCAHILALGLRPDLLVGDLDSMGAPEVARLEAEGVPVRRFPPAKDETDLELALDAALEAGAKRIRIAAALGGRFDQALGNLFLLSRPDLEGLDVRLDDGRSEVFLARRAAEVEGEAGDTLSLLPLGGPATGVRTEGLRYPLHAETLYPHKTRGISNELLGRQAAFSLESGVLICVHIRKVGDAR